MDFLYNFVMDNMTWLIATTLVLYVSSIGLHNFNTLREKQKVWKKYEDKRCKGMHEWVDIGTDVKDKTTKTCSDCGWNPESNGFIKKEYLEAELSRIEFKKELKEFKEEKMKDICEKYNISLDQIEEISESIYGIKKEFTVNYIDKQIKNMRKGKNEQS